MTSGWRRAGWLAAMLLLPATAWGSKPLLDAKTEKRLSEGLRLFQAAGQALREDAPLTPLQRQRRAYGVVELASLDQALAGVLENIRRAAGPDAPPARIHVTPDPALHAYAAEDGSIFIAAGMLRSLDTEDEVAALVAHEYAHVLRHHGGRSALQQLQGIAAGLSALYMDYEYGDSAAARSRPEAEFMRAALLREAAMHTVQSGIVPARARGQEDEADQIGSDLLVKAGYNPVGMVGVLGRLDAWEQQRKAVAAAAQSGDGEIQLAEGVDSAAARFAQDSSAAASARKKLKGDSTDIVGSLIRGVIGGARRKVTDAGSGHRASEARIEAVMAHLQARHGERERPEMRPVPWHADGQARALFESIDVAQRLLAGEESRLTRPGQAQLQALQQLQASPTGQTPLGRYVLLRHTAHALGDDRHTAAWHQELMRDDSLFAAHRLVLSLAGRLEPAVAVSMFETSRQSLGDPPDLLPYGIHVHRRAGNASAAQNYAARCQGASNEALRRACERAR